jgi:hypothetical protein
MKDDVTQPAQGQPETRRGPADGMRMRLPKITTDTCTGNCLMMMTKGQPTPTEGR